MIDWRYLEFSERPLSDACWSVQTGPDGRVYIASCTEHTGGESATVVRYNEDSDALEYLFDLDEVTGDRRDSGRATQCKIHYSFVPDVATGQLHAATHLSGPPIGEKHYNPWASWNDPKRAFRGAYLVSYDTRREYITESRLMIPKEGCRCLALDPERRVLYAVTYPRDHFVAYDLQRSKLADYGRIGSINTQCIFLDRRGRAYFFDDTGCMLRFDPERPRIVRLRHVFPHAPYQSAWHGVLYDAAQDPASGAIYMIPWKPHPHLARFWPEEEAEGHLEDLGPLTQERDEREPMSVNLDHVGGLVFGPDAQLYYARAVWDDRISANAARKDPHTELMRRDIRTGETQILATLGSARGGNHYVSRGAMSAAGTLIFGKILTSPSGVYRVRLEKAPTAPLSPERYLRLWG